MDTIQLIESRRISLTPENGAGWRAEVYDDGEHPVYTGFGFSVDEAITDALSKKEQSDY